MRKIYNTKIAVEDISFKVNKNEIVGILGPNGCGKTTTIGMILGLLKPSGGKVLINGTEIENKRVDLLNNLNFISPYIELPKKIVMITWIIAGILATIGGALYGLDKSFKPFTYFNNMLPIFAAAIVGGIGNPFGAFLGGYVIAL